MTDLEFRFLGFNWDHAHDPQGLVVYLGRSVPMLPPGLNPFPAFGLDDPRHPLYARYHDPRQ
jgi:hypothetical protein